MDYFCTVSDTLAPFLGEETREAKCFTLIDSQMVFSKGSSCHCPPWFLKRIVAAGPGSSLHFSKESLACPLVQEG